MTKNPRVTLRLRHLWPAVLVLGLCPPMIAADFHASAMAWQESHQKMIDEAAAMNESGDTARANQILINYADHEGGAVAAFMVANMLYRSDPVASYRLHQRAAKLLPNEDATILELAMEQHRKGEWEAAIVSYRKAFKSEMPQHFNALLADCLIRSGQLKEGVAAWIKAGHGHNHTEIDFAIYEIYGSLMPAQRRGDLIAKIKAGDSAKLADLIILDVHFDQDWWNSETYEPGLDLDLKLAARTLGKNDPLNQQLAIYARLARQEEKKADDVRKALTAAKLVIGPNAILPENSLLARALCELAMQSKAASAADLWRAHATTLRQRIAKKDQAALHLLCLLAVDTENGQIEELDRLGWKGWHDPEFAVSYLAGLAGQKKITSPDDPEVLAVLAVVPESNFLSELRLHLAGEDHLTEPLLVGAIKAEYRKLSTGLIIPDSYTLKGLFYRLAKKLGMEETSSAHSPDDEPTDQSKPQPGAPEAVKNKPGVKA